MDTTLSRRLALRRVANAILRTAMAIAPATLLVPSCGGSAPSRPSSPGQSRPAPPTPTATP